MPAVGGAATRELAMSPELQDYRIVHFATHGFADDTNPRMSWIALSTVSAEGKPRNGLLRLLDIYNLNLSADLVVLSACSTALGQKSDRKENGIATGRCWQRIPRPGLQRRPRQRSTRHRKIPFPAAGIELHRRSRCWWRRRGTTRPRYTSALGSSVPVPCVPPQRSHRWPSHFGEPPELLLFARSRHTSRFPGRVDHPLLLILLPGWECGERGLPSDDGIIRLGNEQRPIGCTGSRGRS